MKDDTEIESIIDWTDGEATYSDLADIMSDLFDAGDEYESPAERLWRLDGLPPPKEKRQEIKDFTKGLAQEHSTDNAIYQKAIWEIERKFQDKFFPDYEKAVGMAAEKYRKRPSTWHKPGEYKFPKKYYNPKWREEWMLKHIPEMTTLLKLRRLCEKTCWNNEPERKDVDGKQKWSVPGIVSVSYPELVETLGVCKCIPTMRKYIKRLQEWGYLKILGRACHGKGTNGGVAGIRLYLGERVKAGPATKQGAQFSWMEPETVVLVE